MKRKSKKIQDILIRIKGHSVTKNATALGVMQIANYLAPLLVLPFLIAKLGLSDFGKVAIALSVIQIAFVFSDYGFSLSATQSISQNRKNRHFINKKLSSIFLAKTIIITPILITFKFITMSEIGREYESYFTPVAFCIISQAFQPTWLFQGIEKMRKITEYTVLTRIMYMVLVYTFIENPGDDCLVIYLWAISNTAGLGFAIKSTYKSGYLIQKTSFKNAFLEIKESTQFFWSRLALTFYTSANTIIVGSTGAVQAAQFSVCDQIYRAGQNISTPINNAMYPYMANSKNIKLFYIVLAITGGVITAGCIGAIFLAEDILRFFFKIEDLSTTTILKIFLCTTIANYFAASFGYSAFSAIGRVDLANQTVIAGSFFYILILIAAHLSGSINGTNIALAVLATEIFVAILRSTLFFRIRKKYAQQQN